MEDMLPSIEEMEGILSNAGCARFMHTNLHLHTPATPWDWNCCQGQTRKADSVSPEAYYEMLTQTSLELVAVTDHNCVEWCQPLIELAEAGRRKGTGALHVLPGVEITTYEGPHLVALFSEKHDVGAIRSMLVRLGMSGQGTADDRVSRQSSGSPLTVSDVITEVIGLGGIVVGPHVQNKDGLWGPKDFRSRDAVLNDRRLRILAAPSGQIKWVPGSHGRGRLLHKHMDSSVISNSFAFLNVSDCHRLEDLELDTTWLRMCAATLEGVRQIIFEPELRVAHRLVDAGAPVENHVMLEFAKPVEPRHPHLLGVAVTAGPAGGMLDGLKLGFSPHQNCIIGRNYAGKSAILDCIRFVLGREPVDTSALSTFADRLRAFVGDGGEVRAYARGRDGRTYGVARTFSCTQAGRRRSGQLQIEGGPETYVLWQNEFHRESQLVPSDVLPVEVYSQGEVVTIKGNASKQMGVVDALAKLADSVNALTAERIAAEDTLLGRCRQQSREIVRLGAECEELEAGVEAIALLETEIGELEVLSTSPALTAMREWGETQTHIAACVDTLVACERTLLSAKWPDAGPEDTVGASADNASSQSKQPFDETSASPADFVSEASRQRRAALAALSRLSAEGRSMIAEAKATLLRLEQAAIARYQASRAEMAQNTLPADGDLQADLVERISQKRTRLKDLREQERRLKSAKEQMAEAEAQRQGLVCQYHSQWESIRAARRRIVELINDSAAKNVRAELRENDNVEAYSTLLDEIAERLTSQSNRISSKQAQLAIVAASIAPRQLAEIVRGGDARRLVNCAEGVTENTARVLLGMSVGDLHELELCVLHDRFVVLYRKEGDQRFTAIDGALSGGEQALALISVAMIPKELPLLIDQPEDELGPALITDELVEQVRRVKATRQMIFVTHVPNIPVLADSEQIVYVEQSVVGEGTRTSRVRHCGSLDCSPIVSRLLELDGGKDAFERRSERYAAAMSSS